MTFPIFNKRSIFFFAVLLPGFLTACTSAPDKQDSSCVTTTTLGDISQVAGDQVDVHVLLPVGVTRRPEPRLRMLHLVRSGLRQRCWVGGVTEPLLQNAGTQADIIEVSAGIALLPFEEDREETFLLKLR
jgi:ABC-type Zn uptake system ZnuABC Zn-binding protein ZnuA